MTERSTLSSGSAGHPNGRAALIFVVDDDRDQAGLTARAIQEHYPRSRVQLLGGGADLVTQLERLHANAEAPPLPALVLLDLNMGGMDGFETLRRVRSNAAFARMPVVALTGVEDPNFVNRAYQAGATTFLRKPLTTENFRELVNSFALPLEYE